MADKGMNKEAEEALFRIPVFIVTGIILCGFAHLIVLLIIVNFFIVLFAAKREKEIAEFCEYFNTESYRFYKYMTFMTNERPFPFSSMQRLGKFK